MAKARSVEIAEARQRARMKQQTDRQLAQAKRGKREPQDLREDAITVISEASGIPKSYLRGADMTDAAAALAIRKVNERIEDAILNAPDPAAKARLALGEIEKAFGSTSQAASEARDGIVEFGQSMLGFGSLISGYVTTTPMPRPPPEAEYREDPIVALAAKPHWVTGRISQLEVEPYVAPEKPPVPVQLDDDDEDADAPDAPDDDDVYAVGMRKLPKPRTFTTDFKKSKDGRTWSRNAVRAPSFRERAFVPETVLDMSITRDSISAATYDDPWAVAESAWRWNVKFEDTRAELLRDAYLSESVLHICIPYRGGNWLEGDVRLMSLAFQAPVDGLAVATCEARGVGRPIEIDSGGKEL